MRAVMIVALGPALIVVAVCWSPEVGDLAIMDGGALVLSAVRALQGGEADPRRRSYA